MPSIADAMVEEAVRLISTDRVRAHERIFKHRRPYPTAPFQKEMILAANGPEPRVVVEAFRGSAKTTIVAEEAPIIGACLKEFSNALIIGASYDRACERLETIKNEFDNNEDIEQLFGVLKTSTSWAVDKIVLANGVPIQARGAGQSLRGTKHFAQRPDYVVIDDLEDEESTRTPQARQDMLRWLYKTLLPALARNARIRFIGNRLDPEAVIVKIANDPEWKHLRFPILYKDLATGKDRATWPEAFPLEWIYREKAKYERQGLFEDWNQEYMVEADTPEARIFRPEHFRDIVKPRQRTWEATWAMVDPARSVGKRSATTAIPVWSWVGTRLVVWDCLIGQWMPDEIIKKIFEVDGEYRPVAIGVEEDALNQFILQPLRQAQISHGPLPLRAMSAKRFTQGRGKEDFIKSMQPFFAAREVEFAKPMPELEAQFKSFPKGQIDGPNALAYALKMRPGAVMYEDFSRECVVDEAPLSPLLPAHLVLNATQAFVTAVLVQHDGRRLTVSADYIDEGDPGQIAASIVRRAVLEAGPNIRLKVVVHPLHFSQWMNVGLCAALARVPIAHESGGDPVGGRGEIRGLLRSSVRGLPAVQIAHAARWTLNAFAGGYCRQLRPGGQLSDAPEDNLYATLMAGLESFCSLTRVASGRDFTDDDNTRVSADGRRYRSAMVDRSR